MPSRLAQDIAPHLPYLRRYARALTGSQTSGDAHVTACLEALVADPAVFDLGLGARVGLYRLFHQLWSSVQLDPGRDDAPASAIERTAQERLAAMTPASRLVLLLTALEGFRPGEVGEITDHDEAEVRRLLAQAVAEIDRQTATQVLIIEDEPLISMDLAEIVESLGHKVSTIARTAARGGAAPRAPISRAWCSPTSISPTDPPGSTRCARSSGSSRCR